MNQHRTGSRRQGASPTGGMLVVMGALMGAAFYAVDAVIRVFLFQHGSLLDQLIHPAALVLFIRLSGAGLFLVLGTIAYVILRREQISAEQARTTERFLNSVVDNIPDIVFIKDARELRFVRVNRAGERLLGLTRQELIGKNDYDFFPPAQADFFTRKDRDVLESGTELDIPEEEIDTRQLGRRILHTKKVPIPGEDGQPAFLLGVAEDITERRQAELSFKIEKARADHYLQISRAMIVGLDQDGRINLINPRGCEILGWSEAEILGRNWFDTLLPESSRGRERKFLQDMIDRNSAGEARYESEALTRGGEVRRIDWNMALQRGPLGEVVGTLRSGQDVTDRVRTEMEAQHHHQELAHVMRLSTMGEMASGMAHELNQPLTAAISYCATALVMVQKQSSSPEQITEVVSKAMEQAQRAGDIILRLREFARKGSTKKELIDLDNLIREVMSFVEWEVRNSRIAIDLHLHGENGLVTADKVQIEQVLINLVRNGLDAIQDGGGSGGRIRVATRVVGGATVRVSVSDNGAGIDPSILKRLFEPFQTTKTSGMGIGLSISCSIIETHGGRMWGENSPLGGAIFEFELPLAAEWTSAAHPAGPSEQTL